MLTKTILYGGLYRIRGKVFMIRQGDVLLIPRELPDGAAIASAEGLRIAGEHSGHAHELSCDVYVEGDRQYAVLSQSAPLTHQQHKHLQIPAGVYEVRIQRAWTGTVKD